MSRQTRTRASTSCIIFTIFVWVKSRLRTQISKRTPLSGFFFLFLCLLFRHLLAIKWSTAEWIQNNLFPCKIYICWLILKSFAEFRSNSLQVLDIIRSITIHECVYQEVDSVLMLFAKEPDVNRKNIPMSWFVESKCMWVCVCVNVLVGCCYN